MAVELDERFWSKVDKGTGDGCWEWMGQKTPKGYGRIDVGDRKLSAHRISWELANGLIPDAMQIDHRCWNKACVNPVHLRLATHSQNQQNMQGSQENSRSGVRGVQWDKGKKRWDARGYLNGKKVRVGRFRNIEAAEAAMIKWRREHYPYSLMDRMDATRPATTPSSRIRTP